jgi:hypothetical protein
MGRKCTKCISIWNISIFPYITYTFLCATFKKNMVFCIKYHPLLYHIKGCRWGKEHGKLQFIYFEGHCPNFRAKDMFLFLTGTGGHLNFLRR